MTSTRPFLKRLKRLQVVANRANGNQGSFCSCLFHDVARDRVLRRLGLPKIVYIPLSHAPTERTMDRMSEWFGPATNIYFGAYRLQYKRRVIAADIALLELQIGK